MSMKKQKQIKEQEKKLNHIENITEGQDENQGTAVCRKASRIWKWIILVLIILVALAAAGAYIAAAMYYRAHFFPNTMINGIDCSDMETGKVAGLLDEQIRGYRLTVTGRDYSTGESGASLGEILPEDIGLTYANTEEEAERLLTEQNEWSWIQVYLGKKTFSYQLVQGVTFDADKLKSLVFAWDAFQQENMQKAQDAYISEYSAKLNGYEIIPETIGTEFSADEVFQAISHAIAVQEEALDVEALGVYTDAAVKQDDKTMQEAVNSANTWLSTSITYDWNGNEILLDKELLKDWISVVKNEAVLNEKQVESFVREQASQFDTYGKDRRFMTALGVELTLPSGYYGWKTDTAAETEELLALIRQGSTAEREPIYSSTAKQKGMSDIGSSYVEADMTHQHLYLYYNGRLVLETDFVSGNMSDDSATPEGVFGIAYKTTNAVLRGRDYVTPVNYWMPFYNNYGMHDATWRDEFGGDIYLTEGSHGCLNLPLDKAATIYQYMSAGFPVICYYYDIDPLAGQQPEEEVIVYEFNPGADDEDE